MDNMVISIIIPVYNVEKYLRRCIDSVIKQSYKNLEIILVDDGSPDNSGPICDEYAKKDVRIRVIHKANGGLSDARNAGLDIATGEYIGFVDSDDYIAEDMYELLLHNILEFDADIAICGYAHVYDKHFTKCNLSGQKYIYNNAEAMKLVLGNKINSYYWNKLYKKELFSKFRLPVGKVFEDIFTQHLLFAKAKTVVYQDSIKYFYFMSPQSIIRGGFRPNQMDEMEATRQRVAFAKDQYPQFLDIAKIGHIRSTFYLYCKIIKSDYKKYIEEYETAYQEMKNYYENEINPSNLLFKERILIKLFIRNKRWFTFLYRKYVMKVKPFLCQMANRFGR